MDSRLERYRKTAQRRAQARQEQLAVRREQAWKVARDAAALLKEEFGAADVAVFGSLLQPGLFHARSDVDLAVWDMDEHDYYRAVSRLLSIDPAISVDLVEVEFASPRLRKKIEQEGRIL